MVLSLKNLVKVEGRGWVQHVLPDLGFKIANDLLSLIFDE